MFKRLHTSLLAVLLSVTIADRVAAQTCLALPALASYPVNLGVTAQFADGATSYGARLGFGSPTVFGGVSAALNDYDGIDDGSTTLGFDGGISFPVGVTRRAAMCPIASIGYELGPNVDLPAGELETGTLSLAAGVAFGGVAYSTEGLQITPFGAARMAYARAKFELGDNSETDSESFGLIDVGLGFQFAQRFVIRPAFSIPLGLDDSDPVFGLSFVIGF